MTDLGAAAVEYVKAGHHILALRGKRPHPGWHEHWSWDDSIHGVPESDDELAALRGVFTSEGVTGIALLIPQHVLVADIDSEKAANLFDHLAGELDTAVAMSRHGMHAWFVAPGADANVWLDGQTLLFKGFGGYVVAPPSRFATDALDCDKWHSPYDVYTWVSPLSDGTAWLPDAITARLALMRSTPEPQKANTSNPEDFKITRVELREGGFSAYQVHNIDGLVKFVRDTPEGNRNNALAWAAMQAAETGVPFSTTMPQLTVAAVAAGLAEREAHATIRAAYRRKGSASA